jgi:hypothetical protein
MKLHVDNQTLTVESDRFAARFEDAALVSFAARGTAGEFLRREEEAFPLELVYIGGHTLAEDKHQHVTVRQLSDLAARIIITGNDSDRELFVRLDPDTGDLCVTPAGQSARRGLLAARWNVSFAGEAALLLPCINGILVEAGRGFPGADRFPWPFRWNAQLVVAERNGASMMIHSEDTAFKFKALNLARTGGLTTLGFESEQVGPVWQNRAVGGVTWQLNCYEGTWERPADRYRDWMRTTYQLEAKRINRPAWIDDISFCVCWAQANPTMLDALATIYDPHKTLIHLSKWRTSGYDIDYPDYFPTDDASAFVAKANAMGFKVMPHFNYFACYNEHPSFQKLRDWQIRSVSHNQPEGWYWPPDTHDYTRMAYIHPGLGLWRRTIIDAVRQACAGLGAPAAFIDQTLCTWNTDNGLVENMTTVEGMHRMQEEFAAIQPDTVLAGEGLNEISFQRQCFAQAHIHDGWGDLQPHHAQAAHPICSYLWAGHTRLVGYYHLGPSDQGVDIAIEVYRRMGAIPTFIPRGFGDDPARITKDHPVIRKIIEQA